METSEILKVVSWYTVLVFDLQSSRAIQTYKQYIYVQVILIITLLSLSVVTDQSLYY